MPDLLIEIVENGEWVPRARNFDTENDFRLDENNVDGELCKMGQQLLWYGDAYAELKAEAARKKEVTERVSAALDARHRAAMDKPTEGKIRSAVLNDENYMNARNAELASTANLIRVETWYKSLNKKIDCLQALAYKQRIELKHTGYGS
jgi:hypothetical protein